MTPRTESLLAIRAEIVEAQEYVSCPRVNKRLDNALTGLDEHIATGEPLYPFAALKRLRDKLASIPSVLVDAPTRAAIVEGIDELDDAMVADRRAEYAARPYSVQIADDQEHARQVAEFHAALREPSTAAVVQRVRLEREQEGFATYLGTSILS